MTGGKLSSLFPALAAVVVILLELLEPSAWLTYRIPAALLLICLGVPHGACDDHVAWRAFGTSRWAVAAAYLVALVPTAVLWWMAPKVALGIFVIASAYHFGASDLMSVVTRPVSPHARFVAAISRGATLVALLFVDGTAVAPVMSAMGIGGALALPQFAWAVALSSGLVHIASLSLLPTVGYKGEALLSFLLLSTLVAVSHPTVGFAVYFTLWHAREHWNAMRRMFWPDASTWSVVRLAAPNAAAALGGIAVVVWLSRADGLAAMSGWLFVGLATLTMPHLLIVELANGRASSPRLTAPRG